MSEKPEKESLGKQLDLPVRFCLVGGIVGFVMLTGELARKVLERMTEKGGKRL